MTKTKRPKTTAFEAKFIEAAIDKHVRDGEVEIDNPTVVSLSASGGAYVQGWLWVSDEEAGVEPGENPEVYRRDVGDSEEAGDDADGTSEQE